MVLGILFTWIPMFVCTNACAHVRVFYYFVLLIWTAEEHLCCAVCTASVQLSCLRCVG